MKWQRSLCILVVFLMLSGSVLGSEPEKRLQVRESDLGTLIQGKTVVLRLVEGARLEGRVQKVTNDALVVRVNKSSQPAAYAKGKTQISRAAVSRIEGRDLKSRIDAVRSWALEYIETLPDFVCIQHNQSFLRYEPGDWQKRREIVARLQFIRGRESYKTVSVDGKTSSKSFFRVAAGQGHFGSVLHAMFHRRPQARFVYSGTDSTRGRPVDVFKVVHPKGYGLFIGVKRDGKPRKHTRVGYEGEIHVDKRSSAVVRIIFHRLFGIPAKFPIQQGTLQIDYDSVKVGEKYFWLPVERTSTAVGKHDSGQATVQTKTHTTWDNYKRFTVKTKLSF